MTGNKISCFETEDKLEVVSFCYWKEDSEWHKNVHKNGGTAQENIEDTLSCIAEDEKMFQVSVDDELAAFFTRFEQDGMIVLNSFHVLKKYRESWFLKTFWGLVNEKLGNEYYAGLCDRNKAAISHLERNGFGKINEIIHNDKKFVILSQNS